MVCLGLPHRKSPDSGRSIPRVESHPGPCVLPAIIRHLETAHARNTPAHLECEVPDFGGPPPARWKIARAECRRRGVSHVICSVGLARVRCASHSPIGGALNGYQSARHPHCRHCHRRGTHLDVLIILQARHPTQRPRRQRLRRRIRLRQHRQRLRNRQHRGCRWMMMAAGLAGFRQ